MTFFYNLNQKLDEIRATPTKTHGQLTERDMSRAAKGYEKYGKEGMEALAKAGRDGKALDPVRDKYNKYDDKKDVEEGFGDMARKVGGAVKRVAGKAMDALHGSDEDMIRDLQKRSGMPQTGKKPQTIAFHKSNTVDDNAVVAKEAMSPAKQKSFAALAPPTDKITFADKIAGAKKEVDEMLGDVAAEAMKKALGGGRGRDQEMDEAGYSAKAARAGKDIGKPGKQFAKIAKGAAERYGSKERGEKVAGAVLAKLRKKGGAEEMEESSGATTYTVAYKDPNKPGKSYSTQVKATSAAEAKAAFQDWDTTGRFTYLGSRPDVDKVHETSDDNAFTAHKRPRVDAPKVGTITHGRKHDVEEIPGGRRVTRRVDPSGISVGADDEAAQSGEKRSRGRPKKAGGPAQERVTAKSRKTDRTTFQSKKTNEGEDESPDLKAAMAMLKKAGYEVTKGGEEELEEKAVSKKQQKFMGMVHATQKGKKAPSKEVAKVAKEMPKKAATDFASTKHKGLPEKVKSDSAPKKKEKTEEAGGSGTPTASSGFSYGKGIYDSMNRDLENMIKENMQNLRESMSVNMSMNNDAHGGPSKSLTVTATDEDAVTLSQLLKSAGLGGGDSGSSCGCGQANCSCGQEEMDEAYGDTNATANFPDYPTDTETSSDALQYSGGLNKPKSTGQTTVPVIASQTDRQYTHEGQGPSEAEQLEHYHELIADGMDPDAAEEEAFGTSDWYTDGDDEQDAIARMMEMAGVKKKEVDEEKTEEGNKFTGNLAKARAAGKKEADLDGDGDMEKVDESIFAMTAKLWKTYKG